MAPAGSAIGGVGDIDLALYLSPARTSSIIWGIGPAFVFPSANHEVLGQGKFSTGLSAVALTIQGHWLVGALVTEVASVSGESYRQHPEVSNGRYPWAVASGKSSTWASCQ